MKQLVFLFAILPVLLMSFTIEPVEPIEVSIDAISKAIGSGNADALGAYFDKTVEVAVLGEEDIYSKAEAIKVVKTFFATNKPSAFNRVHQGVSPGKDSQYFIGNMTANGKAFRVYVYLNTKGSQMTVQELRFDKG